MENLKYYTNISVFFVVVLLLSNILSTKITTIGPFTFDAGTVLFPLSYIFGDVLTEVYGYKKSRKVIYLGLFSLIFSSFIIYFVGLLPPSSDWYFQESYNNILGTTSRIVFASIIAYFVGEFVNSYIVARVKVIMNGKYLFVRTIGSTIVGQLFDTLIFVLIAFYGLFPSDVLITLIISNYIFKVGIEIIFTPFTYLIIGILKREEKVDYYDKNTNFNPFSLK